MTHPAAIVILAYLALATATPPTDRPPAPGSDSVTRGWSARAALAEKRLQAGGLDACDRAVETAFAGARAKADGAKRIYLLKIEVEGERLPMLAAYGYDGSRLEDFVVVALPPGWLLRQPVGSRTLSVLLSTPSCAFDLCPSTPLAGAPCP